MPQLDNLTTLSSVTIDCNQQLAKAINHHQPSTNLLRERSESVFGVLRTHVVNQKARLQRGGDQLVHLNVLAVELEIHHAVANVHLIEWMPFCCVRSHAKK